MQDYLKIFVISIKYPEKVTLAPDYNPNAKIENRLYDVKRVSEICPIRPPNEELLHSLVGEWEGRPIMAPVTSTTEYSDQPYTLEHPKMMAIRKNSNGKSLMEVVNYSL